MLREFGAVLLLIGTVLLLALLNTNPLRTAESLDVWVRVVFGILGLILLVSAFAVSRPATPAPPATTEYRERLKKTQKELASITPQKKVLAERAFGKAMFRIVTDDIVLTKADIVVSSDDNLFTASGGVAKAILKKAGPDVERELARFRKCEYRQGHVVVTTGGKTKWRAILYPAVIDFDYDRYPVPDVIRSIVQRCLFCAVTLGGQRIAFPVLGGARVMTQTIVDYLRQQEPCEGLHDVVIYAFKSDDAAEAVTWLDDWKDHAQAMT